MLFLPGLKTMLSRDATDLKSLANFNIQYSYCCYDQEL